MVRPSNRNDESARARRLLPRLVRERVRRSRCCLPGARFQDLEETGEVRGGTAGYLAGGPILSGIPSHESATAKRKCKASRSALYRNVERIDGGGHERGLEGSRRVREAAGLHVGLTPQSGVQNR